VIFIRHGESDWNLIFNKNKLLLLPRLIWGLIREACNYMFDNSVFIDSPLSSEGVRQATDLQKALFDTSRRDRPKLEQELINALRGEEGSLSSVLVCSNLRRAVQTGCIALWPRIADMNNGKSKPERILLHNALQEVTRNVDTHSLLTAKGQCPDTAVVKKVYPTFSAQKYLDVNPGDWNIANKKLSRRAHKSMEEFASWCFAREEDIIIVSAGHSIWFKKFFALYLPDKSDKEFFAKKRKMKNCAVVAFNLSEGERSDGSTGYRIEKDSITSLHLGFDKQKDMPDLPMQICSFILAQ
jgi:broad specificity phosphatase PhoE